MRSVFVTEAGLHGYGGGGRSYIHLFVAGSHRFFISTDMEAAMAAAPEKGKG